MTRQPLCTRRPGTAAARAGGSPTRRPHPGANGFTLLELLVVLAIAGLALAIGLPAFQNMVVRSRTEGYAHEVSSLIQHARLEAIRRNRPAIVYFDKSKNQIAAFVDVDRDGMFTPDTSKPKGDADFEVNRIDTPEYIGFEDEKSSSGLASIDGLSKVGTEDRGVIIEPNGSVDAEGAFRIADLRGNHLEIRIAPAATARVELRMWIADAATPAWYAPGDPEDPDRVVWEWK